MTLAHGNGGRRMRALIEEILSRPFGAAVDTKKDAGMLGAFSRPLAMTTDGYSVKPLFFPGGDIGALAVHGTVNDLSVSGALPRFITLSFFIEEGFAIQDLAHIAASAAQAAKASQVLLASGDTKVLPRGGVDGLLLCATGVGEVLRESLDIRTIAPGDVVLASGPLGDHGAAVLLAREEFGYAGDILSDCASVWPFCQAALDIPRLRFMRDPTRGGLAAVLDEIAQDTGLDAVIEEKNLPLSQGVKALARLLGLEPLYWACEGRVIAVVAEEDEKNLLHAWENLPGGEGACRVGTVKEGKGRVIVRTAVGGQRILPPLEDDPLPRIC